MRFRHIFAVSILIQSLLVLSNAYAWPPTYGAEFEFTNSHIVRFGNGAGGMNGREGAEAAKFAEAVRQKCILFGCTVKEISGKWTVKFRVTFENGWWFDIDYDPCVVEIQTKPSTLEELKSMRDTVNDVLFKTAYDVGLETKSDSLAGHFNFGALSAFGNDGGLFLRFFVDYANQPELTAMEPDLLNAPPISALGQQPREAMRKLVDRVNSGEEMSVSQVASEIYQRVYTESYYNEEMHGKCDIVHYQAIGIEDLPWMGSLLSNDRPVELRASPQQNRLEDFILMAALIEARIEFLKRQSGPIEYIDRTDFQFNDREVVLAFKRYVEETGITDWERFLPILPLKMQKEAVKWKVAQPSSIEKPLEIKGLANPCAVLFM